MKCYKNYLSKSKIMGTVRCSREMGDSLRSRIKLSSGSTFEVYIQQINIDSRVVVKIIKKQLTLFQTEILNAMNYNVA